MTLHLTDAATRYGVEVEPSRVAAPVRPEAVDAALRARTGLLPSLPPAIRAAYDEATAVEREAEVRVAALFGLAGYDAFSMVDAALVPDLGWYPMLVRLFLVTPLGILTLLAFPRLPFALRESVAAWQANAAVLLPVSMVYLSRSPEAPYATTAAILVNLFANVTLRVRFRHALPLTGATLLLLAAALLLRPDLDAGLRANLSLSMLLCGVFGILANRRQERTELTSFLLAFREAFRVERLSADREELSMLSSTDALTGLPNRREFDRRLAASWAGLRERGAAFALLMVDVDRFKEVNDALGHVAGDECLVRVASVLSGVASRRRDTVARFGGEEFAVLLSDCSARDAARVGEDVRRALREAAIPRPAGGYLTVSVGVAAARFGSHAEPIDVVAEADRNLYRAKASGRDAVVA